MRGEGSLELEDPTTIDELELSHGWLERRRKVDIACRV